MATKKWFTPALCLLAALLLFRSDAAARGRAAGAGACFRTVTDSIPSDEMLSVIYTVIHSTNDFDIEKVADLYTPNAVVADDEPPYSWNGPTAGVQWVNAVEKACVNNRINKLRGHIEPVTLFQQSADNVYIVVPVSYSGNMPHKQHFHVRGAFTFVLREVEGKWLIKSQVWMQERGMTR